MAGGGTGRVGRTLAAAFLAMAVAAGGAAPALAGEAQIEEATELGAMAVEDDAIQTQSVDADDDADAIAANEGASAVEVQSEDEGDAVLTPSSDSRYMYFDKNGKVYDDDYYYDSNNNYHEVDYVVRVSNVTAGSAAYNGKTKTLTINNLKADSIYMAGGFTGTLTLVINGKSSLNRVYSYNHNYPEDQTSRSLNVKGTGSLAVNNDGDAISVTNFTMTGGTLTATGNYAISATNFTMTGGTLAAVGYNGVNASNFNLKGGVLTASSERDDGINVTNFIMTGGKLNATSTSPYSGDRAIDTVSFVLKKGTINAKDGIRAHILNMQGGTMVFSNTDDTIDVYGTDTSSTKGEAGRFNMSNGTIKITNPSENAGMDLGGSNFTMTGGTLSITGAYGTGIRCRESDYTYRGKTYRYGGKVKLTGGKLSVVCRKASYSAVSATSMTNKLSCLGKITGSLAPGAKFKVAGNLYTCIDDSYYYDYDNGYYSSVSLSNYGSKSTKPKLGLVKFGGHKYAVGGIDAKAFNTKQGKKVKSITFKSSLGTIAGKAFYGAKKLQSVTFKGYVSTIAPKAFSGASALKSVKFKGSVYTIKSNAFNGAKKLQSIIFESSLSGGTLGAKAFAGTPSLTKLKLGYLSYSGYYKKDRYIYEFTKQKGWSKKAFAGAGKSKGAKLTVVTQYDSYDNPDYSKAAKKFLCKYGLSAKAKVK